MFSSPGIMTHCVLNIASTLDTLAVENYGRGREAEEEVDGRDS